MTYTEKGTVEDFIIQELQKLGWKYVEPEEMHQRRKEDFEEPLVVADLEEALKRLNPKVEMTDADLDFVAVSLRTIPANIEGIRRFLDIFRNGLVVPLQKEGAERVLKLVDLEHAENNEFIVTNQFRVEGLRPDKPDIVLLVNGVPLVLIECKNPAREEVDWTDAYKQIKRYEEEIPEIFKYVQVSIATDGIKTYHFPNAFNEEGKDLLSIWKDPYPLKKEDLKNDPLRITIHGLLTKANLLDLIENFTFIRKEKVKSTKIMTRYMQFRASNQIFHRVIDTLQGRQDSKFGLIWHWQGSGKTYTMAFAAWKLFHCPATERPSIFILVDRRDLEEQVEKDFSFIQIPIERIGSIKGLIEVLKWGKEAKRGIFLVTIEKFSQREFTQLKKQGEKIEIARENVIVLADEVHRTQYGKFGTLMRSVFKNAFIFGFTGTPLSKIERNTFQKFCPKDELYLDRYSMLDALEDGFTVALCYQARLPDYHLKKQQLKEFTKFEEEEIKALPSEEQRELRKKIRRIKDRVMKKPGRVKLIAKDVSEHFSDIVEPTDLKAMIVTVDREACALYKNAIDQLLPPSYSEIVMTVEQNPRSIIKDYLQNLQTRYGTRDVKDIHDKIIEEFKTKKEPKILIVTEMLITGFDAPNLWTMYLDKPLREHRLLQAIARTNRPVPTKEFGLINDYVGVLKELEKAFEQFEAGDANALRAVIRDLKKEKEAFETLIFKALKIFERVRREDTYESLESALDILIDPQTAKNFETIMKDLMKSYEMLKGEAFLMDYLSDYTWLVKIYVAYNKKFKKAKVDELKVESLSKKTVKLIQETIDAKEIEDAYPTVSVDEQYIKTLRKSVPKTVGAAIDVMTNIRHEAKTHPNSPFFINLSREVESTYEELRVRKLETKEAVQRLLDISERIARWKEEEEEVGKDKYPVYEAVKSILPDVAKQKAASFVNELLTHLREKGMIFNGWQQQRDVRRQARAETRLLLLSKFREHRDRIDKLTGSVFDALEGIK